MNVIEPGHVYELPNLEHPGTQLLTFIKRSSAAINYANTEHPGTNVQSVIRALIDRSQFLNDIIPCDETQNAVYHLRMALFEYEARAWRRKQEKLNKEAGQHTEQSMNAHRDGYDDVPFSEFEIELLPVGPDGHVIPHAKSSQ